MAYRCSICISDRSMYTVDILIGFDDYTVTYTVGQGVVEELLRTESAQDAIDVAVDGGSRQEDGIEGDIFLSYLDEDFGDFQNALMDLVCDLEAEA